MINILIIKDNKKTLYSTDEYDYYEFSVPDEVIYNGLSYIKEEKYDLLDKYGYKEGNYVDIVEEDLYIIDFDSRRIKAKSLDFYSSKRAIKDAIDLKIVTSENKEFVLYDEEMDIYKEVICLDGLKDSYSLLSKEEFTFDEYDLFMKIFKSLLEMSKEKDTYYFKIGKKYLLLDSLEEE